MIEKVQALLQEFEDKLASGKVVTFTVEISPEGMYVLPEPKKNNEAKRVHLSSEFIKTFEVFFSDAKEIRCNSPQ